MEGAGVEPHEAERRSRAGSTHNRIASQRTILSAVCQVGHRVQVTAAEVEA